MSLPIPELSSIESGIAKACSAKPDLWSKLAKLDEWTVYSDGSAPIVNPGGATGFASIFILSEDSAFEVNGGVAGRLEEPATSNNRAEISGAISILELALKSHSSLNPQPQTINIICDSRYVLNCAQGKWQKKKNRDLWRRFDQLACACRAKKIKVLYEWTKAHVGTKWNERADILAKEAALAAHNSSARANSNPLKPQGQQTPSQQETTSSKYHYRLRLFTQKKGSSLAEGFYELSTSARLRQNKTPILKSITLDEAEYQTLNAALADLISTLEENGRKPSDFKVQIVSSRELMLKQLQGVYSVKSERLIPLHRKSKELSKRFAEIGWLEGNKLELKAIKEQV